MKKSLSRSSYNRGRQRGAITMFSAVLILILLTEMVIFAVHTGVFEQRKSSNDMRQKLAFHMADAGIQQAKQFMQTNALLVASNEVDLLPILDSGGDIAGYHPGWLQEGRWSPCSGNYSTADYTHPCWAEPIAKFRDNSYFYNFAGSNELPAGLGEFDDSVNRKVTMHALLCMLDINLSSTSGPPVSGCVDPSVGAGDSRYFMVTLLARGEADCDDTGNNCQAEALIADKIGSYGPGGGDGGPDVPLTARTNVPLMGTVNVVPNPNGGGVGVPISSWLNANKIDSDCPQEDEEPVTAFGSYETCEAEDWYGSNILPEDLMCHAPGGQCFCKESENDRLLTYSEGGKPVYGIDIVEDADFPCDLFLYTFGVPKTKYMDVFNTIPPNHQLTDCDSLNAASAGPYWVSGEECDLPGRQIGSKNAPVFLISAAKYTSANAKNTDFFGVLFVTDAEYEAKGYACEGANTACGFKGTGGATIYGSAIMDAKMDHFQGNFSLVYVDTVISLAMDTGGFGSVSGGWTDFHAHWR